MRVWLLALALAVPAYANAQTTPIPNDGISRVMRELERVLLTADQRGFTALLADRANTSQEFHDDWLQPGVTRAVVKDRRPARL